MTMSSIIVFLIDITVLTLRTQKLLRGLPLIMYASRGGGGVNPNAYKCVQGGRGGLNMAKNTHFVRRLIESGIISAQRKVNG